MRELTNNEIEHVSGGAPFLVVVGVGAAAGGTVEAMNGGNALEIAIAAALSGIGAAMAGHTAAALGAKAFGEAILGFFGTTGLTAAAANVPAEMRKRREDDSYVDPFPPVTHLLG